MNLMVNLYLSNKEKGNCGFKKEVDAMGNATGEVLFFQKTFSPFTGELMRSDVQRITLEQIDEQIKTHEGILKNLVALKDDLVAELQK